MKTHPFCLGFPEEMGFPECATGLKFNQVVLPVLWGHLQTSISLPVQFLPPRIPCLHLCLPLNTLPTRPVKIIFQVPPPLRILCLSDVVGSSLNPVTLCGHHTYFTYLIPATLVWPLGSSPIFHISLQDSREPWVLYLSLLPAECLGYKWYPHCMQTFILMELKWNTQFPLRADLLFHLKGGKRETMVLRVFTYTYSFILKTLSSSLWLYIDIS